MHIVFGHKAHRVQAVLQLVLRLLDALGDVDFLLARKQRHLAHLLQVHAHWIVQHVHFGDFALAGNRSLIRLIHFGLGVRHLGDGHFDRIQFAVFDDAYLHPAQTGDDLVHQIHAHMPVGQGCVQIIIGQMVLILGQPDQFAQLGLHFRGVDVIIDHYRNRWGGLLWRTPAFATACV